MATEVRQYFQGYRSPTWTAPVDELPQEAPIGEDGQIQPSGWVMNSSASVMIDDEGLHILDGSIFLLDNAGEAVLDSSGFRGSWLDFLRTNIYNGGFSNGIGTSAEKPAMEEVLISGDLPYWEVIRTGGATTTNSHIFHASSTVADHLLEARIVSANMPDNAIIGISQLIPISNVSARRGGATPGGYARATVSFEVEATDNNHTLYINVLQYGYSGTGDTLVALGSERSSSNSLSSTGVKQIWADTGNLDPKCVAIRVQVILENTFNGTGAIVRVRNVELNPSVSAITISSTDGANGAGVIRMSDTGTVMIIDPSAISASGTGKTVEIIGDLALHGVVRPSGSDLWLTPVFQNSWTHYGSPFGPARYRKDAMGYVHVEGLIMSGVVGATMFNLPAGFRPGRELIYSTVANDVPAQLRVQTNGNVYSPGGSNTWVSIACINFKAEA